MTHQRHPTTRTWTFPERADLVDTLPGGIERTNLKELAARPDRLEHHLVVVARLGVAQLELATASEPLYFAHVNISDEYALPLPTGDPLLDAFPMRTFVSDAASGADIGRYNHKCGDLVLHPVGHAHWPGKLRPPYEGMPIPPGMRRCGVSLVYCAAVPTPSSAPQLPPPAKPDDVKAYANPPPALGLVSVIGPLDRLAPLGPPSLANAADTGLVIARVGDTELALADNPREIAPPHGGWVVVLAIGSAASPAAPPQTGAVAPPAGIDAGSATGTTFAVGDMLRVPAGARLPAANIARCLVLRGAAEPQPIPSTWRELPPPPFPVFEEGARGALPFSHGALRVEDRSPAMVAVSIEDAVADVPRHWLARMLFRIAVHDLRLNYVETYGGLFVDDSRDAVSIGLHVGSRKVAIDLPRADAKAVIERLYRAVAPPDYRERIA